MGAVSAYVLISGSSLRKTASGACHRLLLGALQSEFSVRRLPQHPHEVSAFGIMNEGDILQPHVAMQWLPLRL